jgi:hypothetical protein
VLPWQRQKKKRVTWYVRSLGGAEDVGLELLPVELGGAGAVLGVDVLTACALNAVVSMYSSPTQEHNGYGASRDLDP